MVTGLAAFILKRKISFLISVWSPKPIFSSIRNLFSIRCKKRRFLPTAKVLLPDENLRQRFGWKIGDTVTLKGTIYLGNWDFVLRGIYHGRDETIDETQFFFHWDYLNEVIKQRTTTWADQSRLLHDRNQQAGYCDGCGHGYR